MINQLIVGVGQPMWGQKHNHTIKMWKSNLGSYKPGSQWAEPHSWWAGGCAGTETPSLEHRTSHTSGVTRCRSPAGNAPVGPCPSTHTGSHKQWQTQPKSALEELHPRGRLWPACNTDNNKKLKARQTHMDLKNSTCSGKQVWNVHSLNHSLVNATPWTKLLFPFN